ncbi:hypothetical protein D3C77_404310 [compost metagenome]
MLGALVVGRDDLAESYGAPHGLIITHQVFGQSLLGQRFPAADYLGGIVYLELVILVLQHLLKAPADGALLDGEYQHLVIGEQASLNGLGEVDDEQLFAVERFVIHRAQGDFA